MGGKIKLELKADAELSNKVRLTVNLLHLNKA